MIQRAIGKKPVTIKCVTKIICDMLKHRNDLPLQGTKRQLLTLKLDPAEQAFMVSSARMKKI